MGAADLRRKADEELRSFSTARISGNIDSEIAIGEALTSVGGKIPASLFSLTFENPRIGLDDSRMPIFLQHLAAIFDSRIASRILTEIAPVAAQRVGLLRDLIQLWQNEPEA